MASFMTAEPSLQTALLTMPLPGTGLLESAMGLAVGLSRQSPELPTHDNSATGTPTRSSAWLERSSSGEPRSCSTQLLGDVNHTEQFGQQLELAPGKRSAGFMRPVALVLTLTMLAGCQPGQEGARVGPCLDGGRSCAAADTPPGMRRSLKGQRMVRSKWVERINSESGVADIGLKSEWAPLSETR